MSTYMYMYIYIYIRVVLIVRTLVLYTDAQWTVSPMRITKIISKCQACINAYPLLINCHLVLLANTTLQHSILSLR